MYNNRKFLNKNWTEFNGSTIIDARDYTNDNCSTFKEYCCYVPVYIDTRAYTIIELFERFYNEGKNTRDFSDERFKQKGK